MSIRNKPPSKEYMENWQRIFRPSPPIDPDTQMKEYWDIPTTTDTKDDTSN